MAKPMTDLHIRGAIVDQDFAIVTGKMLSWLAEFLPDVLFLEQPLSGGIVIHYNKLRRNLVPGAAVAPEVRRQIAPSCNNLQITPGERGDTIRLPIAGNAIVKLALRGFALQTADDFHDTPALLWPSFSAANVAAPAPAGKGGSGGWGLETEGSAADDGVALVDDEEERAG